MDALLVDGDEIELTPDPPWSWVVPVRLKVTALPGHRVKAKGKLAIWESEILTAGLLAAGKMYTSPGFDAPGSVVSVTMVVNPATMSKVFKDTKLPLATVATTGTFVAAVVPAVNPSTGAPDPLVAKTGTWKVVTEQQSVAKSGQPKAASAEDDEGRSKGVAAGGANKSGAATAENKVHYVAVQLQDRDGNVLPDHRIAISTPDGRRAERRTSASGASRIDGIQADGEATVRLLDINVLPRVQQPPVPSIGITLVDEDGQPVPDVEFSFTSPSGAELGGTTNTKGTFRLNRAPEVGTWQAQLNGVPGLFPGSGGDTTSGVDSGGDGVGVGGDGDPNKPAKRLYLLELPDVLCRTSSCLIMPEGEAPSASTEHPALSGVCLFAAAIRLCEERPEFKLFIGAHTDSVDTTEDNQVLSNERAQMALAILTGDRESYKQLAHARHRKSDIKQMLHWCVTAHPDVFTCDPGPIDDTDNLWTPVHTFENEFNYFKYYFQASQTPDLELTGSMGPNNWGALFDVMQFGIARELGVTVKEVASLRANIKWLDDSRKALGFSEHHPIDAVGTDNYESQSNRRVELLFFDEKDILPDLAAAESDPAGSEIYLPGIYERIVLEGSGMSAKRPESVLAVPSYFSRQRFFPKPSGFPAAMAVRQFLTEHPEMTAIVVGHSDAGGDSANKELATLRAEAFRALILGDAAYFEQRVLDPWSIEEMQWMLHVIEVAKSPCYAGQADGFVGLRTEAAIGLFQVASNDLPTSYEPTDDTRRRLAQRYTESIGAAPELAGRVRFVGVGDAQPPKPERASGVHKHLNADHAVYRRRVDVFFCSRDAEGRAADLEKTPQLYEGWLGSAALAAELQLRQVPIQVFGDYDTPLGDVSVELKSMDEQQLSFSGVTDANGFARFQLLPGVYVVTAEGKQDEVMVGVDSDCGINVYLDGRQDGVNPARGSGNG